MYYHVDTIDWPQQMSVLHMLSCKKQIRKHFLTRNRNQVSNLHTQEIIFLQKYTVWTISLTLAEKEHL